MGESSSHARTVPLGLYFQTEESWRTAVQNHIEKRKIIATLGSPTRDLGLSFQPHAHKEESCHGLCMAYYNFPKETDYEHPSEYNPFVPPHSCSLFHVNVIDVIPADETKPYTPEELASFLKIVVFSIALDRFTRLKDHGCNREDITTDPTFQKPRTNWSHIFRELDESTHFLASLITHEQQNRTAVLEQQKQWYQRRVRGRKILPRRFSSLLLPIKSSFLCFIPLLLRGSFDEICLYH
eukprot:TRINITY_DN4304_c0_g1_i2.p1 TRINITY_DN4304_c0_g1~~TRINITY_DN4304_c0_g1_i2.p1  ORF type:complete len:239 (+),score=41.92 TRINITY_DN4304_c0_g1_i2:267-983(+)